jgi:diguanylate cyclase (GGDEF)-like protein/PAS domain S-box-containing protein
MEKGTAKTILLIENDPEEACLVQEMLSDWFARVFELTQVESTSDAERYLALRSVDILMLDLGLTDLPKLEAVQRVRAAAPRASIVLLSSPDNEEIAVRAIGEGAQDYLIKGQFEACSLARTLLNSAARKLCDEAVFVEREYAQATLDCIGDAVICTDSSGNITFLNPVAERITGWPLGEATGRPMSETVRIVDASTRRSVLGPIAKANCQNRSPEPHSNCVLTRRDGHELFIEDSVAPIRDRNGQVIGLVIVFRDVTVTRMLEEKLRDSAGRDFLTGLPNRMLLNDRLGQAIALARRNMGGVAVLCLNLDSFKQINNSFGYEVGDKLLQSVAARLADSVRSPDTVSRLGKDEFVVLIQDIQRSEDGGTVAGRLLQAVAEAYSINQHEISLTTSIGVSVYPTDAKDAETLIKNAHIAMHHAKKKGKMYEFFRSDMLFDPAEHGSNEGEPIVDRGSKIFSFRTKVFSFIRKERSL